jgi:hypothetical protein
MKTFFEERELELEKLVAVCTDSCSSMTGSNAGLISLLENHPRADSVVIPLYYSPRELSIKVRRRF